jgi:hypothetical protein
MMPFPSSSLYLTQKFSTDTPFYVPDSSEINSDPPSEDRVSTRYASAPNIINVGKSPNNTSPLTRLVATSPNYMNFTSYGKNSDEFGRRFQGVNVPRNVLLVAAHGSVRDGSLGSEDGKYTYTPLELAQGIIRRAKQTGLKINDVDKIVVLGCDGALIKDGNYMQELANILKTNVYSGTETTWANPFGSFTVAGTYNSKYPSADGDTRNPAYGDPGRMILFPPGDDPKKNKLLQVAIIENKKLGKHNTSGLNIVGRKDIEFNPSESTRKEYGIPTSLDLSQGRCYNQYFMNCLPK